VRERDFGEFASNPPLRRILRKQANPIVQLVGFRAVILPIAYGQRTYGRSDVGEEILVEHTSRTWLRMIYAVCKFGFSWS
jgi:hypothetical protein